MNARFYLENARAALGLANVGDRNRKAYLAMAASQLRKAIGAANRERNRRVAGLALLALAKVRAAA